MWVCVGGGVGVWGGVLGEGAEFHLRGGGCIRRGEGGGGGLKGGRGGLAGTPLLLRSPYGPRRRWAKDFFWLKSSWHRRRRSQSLAVSLKHWKGRWVGGM